MISPSRRNLYAKWGVLLSQIQEYTGGSKDTLAKILKDGFGIESVSSLSDDALNQFIQEVVAHMATEYGIEIYFEKAPLHEMTLTELFEYYDKKESDK